MLPTEAHAIEEPGTALDLLATDPALHCTTRRSIVPDVPVNPEPTRFQRESKVVFHGSSNVRVPTAPEDGVEYEDLDVTCLESCKITTMEESV